MAEFKSTASQRLQSVSLVLLRLLIGWQFLYEGYFKLILPAWTRDGHPLGRWTAGLFFKEASGPLSTLLQRLATTTWMPWIDRAVATALVLIGLSLILGILTQIGSWGALIFLTLIYLAAIPLQGTPQPGSEGVSLLVNKNLIEWAAVLVLLAFRTGEIAGLDILLQRKRQTIAAAV
jgi:thiosulfate dehydrogenase [quinone] large subunit